MDVDKKASSTHTPPLKCETALSLTQPFKGILYL